MRNRIVLALLLTLPCAAPVSAADFNGRWLGTVFEGSATGQPIGLELRQVGDRIIGVMLSKVPFMLTDGRVTERGATFQAGVEGEIISFQLTVDGDHLTGKVAAKKDGVDGGAQTIDAYRAGGSGPFAGSWTATIAPQRADDGDSEVVTLILYPGSLGVSGVMRSAGGAEEVFTGGEIKDGRLRFRLFWNGTRYDLAASGAVSGNVLEGTASVPSTTNKDVEGKKLVVHAVKQAALKPESGALGSWAGALITTTGESLPFPFHLHRHGDEYSGGMTSDAARGEFMDIAVSGNHVTFVLRTERESVHFDLKLDGDEMAGTAVETSNGKETKYRLSAVRRM